MATMIGRSASTLASSEQGSSLARSNDVIHSSISGDSMNDTFNDVRSKQSSQVLSSSIMTRSSGETDTKVPLPEKSSEMAVMSSDQFHIDPQTVDPPGQLEPEHTGYSLPPSDEDDEDDDHHYFPSSMLQQHPPPELLDAMNDLANAQTECDTVVESSSDLRNSTEVSTSLKRSRMDMTRTDTSSSDTRPQRNSSNISSDSTITDTTTATISHNNRSTTRSRTRRRTQRVSFESSEEDDSDTDMERWDKDESYDGGRVDSSSLLLNGSLQPMKRRRSQRLQNSLSSLVPIDVEEWKKQENQQEIWVPGFEILEEGEVFGLSKHSSASLSISKSASSADLTDECEFCRTFNEEDLSDEVFDQKHYRAMRRETLLYDHLLKLRKQQELEKSRRRKKQRSSRANGSSLFSSSKSNSPLSLSDNHNSQGSMMTMTLMNRSVSLLTVDDVEFEKTLSTLTAAQNLEMKNNNQNVGGGSSDGSSLLDHSSENGKKSPLIPDYVPKKFHRPEFNYPVPIARIKKHSELYQRKMMNEWCNCGRQSLKYAPLNEDEQKELDQMERRDWFKYYPFSIRRTDLFCNEEIRKDPSKLQNAELKTVNRKRLIVLLDTLRKQRGYRKGPIDVRVLKDCRSLISAKRRRNGQR